MTESQAERIAVALEGLKRWALWIYAALTAIMFSLVSISTNLGE